MKSAQQTLESESVNPFYEILSENNSEALRAELSAIDIQFKQDLHGDNYAVLQMLVLIPEYQLAKKSYDVVENHLTI